MHPPEGAAWLVWLETSALALAMRQWQWLYPIVEILHILGFVIVAGCGHAGTINTVEYARRILGAEPAYAIVGGLHLFAAPDSALAWTATRLRSAHLGYLLGAHCTGIEAVFRIRELADLELKRAVV